jgi:hypothetical protein
MKKIAHLSRPITEHQGNTMITIEHTDTFGGEANYCWVNRYHCKEPVTDRQLIRLAKRVTGLTGTRCQVFNCGGDISIKPRRVCQIVFVGYEDEAFLHHASVEIDSRGERLC